jgi:hypothetical protein
MFPFRLYAATGDDDEVTGTREDRHRRRAGRSTSFPDPAMCPIGDALRDISIIRKTETGCVEESDLLATPTGAPPGST